MPPCSVPEPSGNRDGGQRPAATPSLGARRPGIRQRATPCPAQARKKEAKENQPGDRRQRGRRLDRGRARIRWSGSALVLGMVGVHSKEVRAEVNTYVSKACFALDN